MANATKKWVGISMCAIQNNVTKIKGKYLVFKTSIAGIHTCLLINNGSEAKLINKFFVCLNKTSTFQLEKLIQLMLDNRHEEMDSIAIEHYLTKIHTQRKKEKKESLCAKK